MVSVFSLPFLHSLTILRLPRNLRSLASFTIKRACALGGPFPDFRFFCPARSQWPLVSVPTRLLEFLSNHCLTPGAPPSPIHVLRFLRLNFVLVVVWCGLWEKRSAGAASGWPIRISFRGGEPSQDTPKIIGFLPVKPPESPVPRLVRGSFPQSYCRAKGLNGC